LCFTNVFVHLGTISMNTVQLSQFHDTWGLQLNAVGPMLPVKLFTHAFVHGDILHIAGNLLLLWLMGTVLEATIGSLPFALLYLASLLGAVLLHGGVVRLFFPDAMDVTLIGASGAISGITGYTALRFYYLRVMSLILPFSCLPIPYPFWIPMWVYAGVFAVNETWNGVAMVLGGQDSYVAHWAHLGGLALGAGAALLLKSPAEANRERVIEGSARATTKGKPVYRSMQDVWNLLQRTPDDPELLEAMAGLILAEGVPGESHEYYMRAVQRFIDLRQPDRAAVAYMNLMRAFPDAVLSARDQMTVAGQLERLGHHADAAQAFTLGATAYPGTEEAQTALLRTATLYIRQLNNPAHAAQLLQYLLREYPASTWAEMARERLRELQKMGVVGTS
jgi:membrane associated rhomboid family serine protease